jgi:mediator of RNA polymerase II transcription subunit 21
MSDRLSQLQDQVNYLAQLFCDATGVLQEKAKPSKFENFAESLNRGYEDDGKEKDKSSGEKEETSIEEIKMTFAELITSTAKKIDTLIDSLPNEDESNEELQMNQLKELEVENSIAARQLEYVTSCAENLLQQIQNKISQIAESQLSANQEFNVSKENLK